MKPNIVAQTLSRLAKSFGLVADEPSPSADDIYTRPRSPEEVKRALAAARRLRAQAREMKLGVTDADILRWVKEGRR